MGYLMIRYFVLTNCTVQKEERMICRIHNTPWYSITQRKQTVPLLALYGELLFIYYANCPIGARALWGGQTAV